ncbi:unnamed protein product [Didymodactylos carnosus]|uniref:Uncharacterized protein n=1 Tax=Didymodactylos carnosus TaxID=1234261 RepID=A0A814WJQ4_9BILA|nr:unnamed protein product [Didymodactylos carnosus]CAF1223763.1 unnamed protein product [Didymodactylos carnosus]CAF3966863.1 unnamed protein product [Didymodactylos carnosus]CAF4032005.1 unnamed protein product [Didymodactylos carnosus]
MFSTYLSYYYAYLKKPRSDFWNVFYYLSETYEITENIHQDFVRKLTLDVRTLSIKEFLQLNQDIIEHLKNVKSENYTRFMTIIETLFEEFTKNLLKREQPYNQLLDIDLKELLKNSLELSLARTLQKPSSLLIIRRLLFQNNSRTLNVVDRIYTLFYNLKDFDQDLCRVNEPADIIHDEWLQDFLFDIPENFCTQLNHHDYRNLCNTYEDNRWTNFIWSRIMYLSILKSKSGKSNNMLLKLNQWMIDVKHDTFNIKDTLTNIIIVNLFEIIIKDVESVLALPNIPSIIDFIFRIKNEEIHGINLKEINNFIQRGQSFVQDILLLKGQLNMNI